jgi:hypothetical protein
MPDDTPTSDFFSLANPKDDPLAKSETSPTNEPTTETPTDGSEFPDIPDYLLRHPDGSFVHPEPLQVIAGPRGGGMTDASAVELIEQSLPRFDAVTAPVSEMTQRERDRQRAEEIKREVTAKRITKMKVGFEKKEARAADREAMKAGKTWNATRARWE